MLHKPAKFTLHRPPLPLRPIAAVMPDDMERIRRVYDEDCIARKFNSVVSPREDAQMSRSQEKRQIPCECVIELYELLWRWSHRNISGRGFAETFGFTIPDTVIIIKGKIYAWYFISKRDGTLMRKTEASLNAAAIEKKLCRDRVEGESPNAAVWMPRATQFPEARCHSPYVDFLSAPVARRFLSSLRISHSGIFQAFVEPHGVFNFLARTVQFCGETSLCVRTNRQRLAPNGCFGTVNFERVATFEGWPGLSSTASRYRNHKHSQMEELILVTGETLNQRLEQERVRQMLFLEPTQHIALHFKVTKDHLLYFVYASILDEKEVILQTRPQLVMGDVCMTDPLRLSGLLPGGTDQRATPGHAPTCMLRDPNNLPWKRHRTAWADKNDEPSCSPDHADESDGVSVLEQTSQGGVSVSAPPTAHGSRQPMREHLSSMAAAEKGREVLPTVLPKVSYARPAVPAPPYSVEALQHDVQESGRYEYPPPYVIGDASIKKPLVTHLSDASGAAGSGAEEKNLLPAPLGNFAACESGERQDVDRAVLAPAVAP